MHEMHGSVAIESSLEHTFGFNYVSLVSCMIMQALEHAYYKKRQILFQFLKFTIRWWWHDPPSTNQTIRIYEFSLWKHETTIPHRGG